MPFENLNRFGLMHPYVSGQANLYPEKRIKRLRELIDSKSPNICVLRGEGMGDVIMTTPTLLALKKYFSNPPRITYATNTRYLDGGLEKVLRWNPSVDEVIDRDRLDESDYDVVINLHCPCVTYEKKENPPVNRIDLFAKHAGVKLEDKVPKYFIQQDEIDRGKEFLYGQGRFKQTDKIILVHIFTTTTRRNLDDRKFKDALMELSRIGYRLVILSHASDYSSDVFFNNIPGSVVLQKDVREVAGVMKSCDLVLCPDSSILHLAGALDIPTVSIFGHTDPRARINYYRNAVAIWPGGDFHCAPCWNMSCIAKEACYKAITKEMIVNTCVEQINSQKKVAAAVPMTSSNTIQIERI